MDRFENSKRVQRIARAGLLMAGLLLSVNASAALNAYLRLEGAVQGEIKGGVSQAGREDSIRVIGYSHNNDTTQEWDKCKMPGSSHQPLELIKELDVSTSRLYRAYANNELITSFILRFYEPAASGEETNAYTIELTNAHIVAIRQEMLNNKYPENIPLNVMEHVSFVYEDIMRTWEDGGVSSADHWQSACGK